MIVVKDIWNSEQNLYIITNYFKMLIPDLCLLNLIRLHILLAGFSKQMAINPAVPFSFVNEPLFVMQERANHLQITVIFIKHHQGREIVLNWKLITNCATFLNQ